MYVFARPETSCCATGGTGATCTHPLLKTARSKHPALEGYDAGLGAGDGPVEERWRNVRVEIDVEQLGRIGRQRSHPQNAGNHIAIEGVQIDLQQIQAFRMPPQQAGGYAQ